MLPRPKRQRGKTFIQEELEDNTWFIGRDFPFFFRIIPCFASEEHLTLATKEQEKGKGNSLDDWNRGRKSQIDNRTSGGNKGRVSKSVGRVDSERRNRGFWGFRRFLIGWLTGRRWWLQSRLFQLFFFKTCSNCGLHWFLQMESEPVVRIPLNSLQYFPAVRSSCWAVFLSGRLRLLSREKLECDGEVDAGRFSQRSKDRNELESWEVQLHSEKMEGHLRLLGQLTNGGLVGVWFQSSSPLLYRLIPVSSVPRSILIVKNMHRNKSEQLTLQFGSHVNKSVWKAGMMLEWVGLKGERATKKRKKKGGESRHTALTTDRTETIAQQKHCKTNRRPRFRCPQSFL